MPASLREVLTAGALLNLAGDLMFRRGAEYQAEGHVLELHEVSDGIRARVRGQGTYEVRLWTGEGELGHSCDCPAAETGSFCKHGVAAGLHWIGQQDGNEFAQRRDVKPGPVRAFLASLDKARLVDLLVEHARFDDRLQQRLKALAALCQGAPPNLPALRKLITKACHVRDAIESHEVPAFVQRLDDAVDSIEELIRNGHGAAAIELAEHAIDEIAETIELLDDRDGEVGQVLGRAQELHLAACHLARPDPVELAQKLFQAEISSQWGLFHQAAHKYRDVLGPLGLAKYRELAEVIWMRVPTLGPGDERDSEMERRFTISAIMEALADAAGDLDEWIRVQSRDLSSPNRFLQIARRCREHGRADLALQWAERGIQPQADIRDLELRQFLAQTHAEADRHDQALELIWSCFQAMPCAEQYAVLKSYAERAGQAPIWRARGLELLRARIAQRGTKKPSKFDFEHRLDRSADELVGVLIIEGEVEAAWQAAATHGCGDATMLALARLREKDHPADVIPVYRKHFDTTIDQRNNRAYDQAVKILSGIHALALRTGGEKEFDLYLAGIRREHKAKRNFMARLEQVRWT